ncbi:MAG: DUF1648 domain-containing protein [Planctomycetes bacterium]|nr:DUF1648 domain-containing protein [Planctomycetota bacterium]
MLASRPQVEHRRSPADWLAETVAVAGLIIGLVLPAYYWSSLPERVPSHFGAFGQPNAWSARGFVWFLPAVMVVVYLVLTSISLIPPRYYNYPWQITAENAPRQVRIVRRLLCVLKAELVWLFVYLTWQTIRVALGQVSGLGSAFLPVTLLVVFGTVIYYFVRAASAR